MKNELRIIAAVCTLVSIASAQETAAPDLQLKGSPTEDGEPASAPDAPSLAGGFVPQLDNQIQEETLDKAYALLDTYGYEEARALFASVLKVSPNNNRALIGLSIIHTKNYQYAEALGILESLLQRQPNNVAIKNNAAWIYATADDPDVRNGQRAVDLARQALVDAPGSYHIWSTMAEGYYIIGQFKKAQDAAMEAMRMAIRLNANSDNLREYRSQIAKCQIAVQALSLIE